MTAYELLRRGVSVRLIDAADGPATTSRAASIHARTMEVLDQAGLYETFASRAVQVTGMTLHADGEVLALLNTVFRQATRFNKVLFLNQVFIEELLRDAVIAAGGQIEWGVRLTSLTERTDCVDVTLAHTEGRGERVSVPWLVGTDGGHSQVRRELGITLQGSGSETWLIADAELDFTDPVSHDRIRWVRADGGTAMIFPLVGDRCWRLLDTVDVDYDGDSDTVARRFATKLTRGWAPRSLWTLRHGCRCSPSNSVRCPQCSRATASWPGTPRMCTPRPAAKAEHRDADAFNLAWKLASVIMNKADPVLLDTYSAERVPVGQALCRTPVWPPRSWNCVTARSTSTCPRCSPRSTPYPHC